MLKVLKFGGTSLSSSDIVKNVADIVLDTKKKCKTVVVVVSASSGVTDKLLQCAKTAESNGDSAQNIVKEIQQKYMDVFKNEFKNKKNLEKISPLFDELADIVKGISLVRECSLRTMDYLLSFGERICAQLLTIYLNEKQEKTEFVDARDIIVTDNNYGEAHVLFDVTNDKVVKRIKSNQVYVVTGFIGSTKEGVTTTLGRGGSDYTASLLGAAINADQIEIWTDVNGFMSADPKLVKDAFVLPKVSYEEAMEMSYFGAKVIHPQTIGPAIKKKIPVLIKNTFSPSNPGTIISLNGNDYEHPVKGIASFKDISLINIQGSGMVGVPGVAKRLFGALALKNINVIMISQASSEHSICFAIQSKVAKTAQKLLKKEFEREISAGKIDQIERTDELTIIAAVGENMKGTPGISGKLFESLGQNSINVIAIAQGYSERNVSLIVHSDEATKAVNVIHSAFYLSQTVANVIVVGTGSIGSMLLRQIEEEQEELLAKKGLILNICGLASSKKMIFDENGLDLKNWKKLLEASEHNTNINKLMRKVRDLKLVNTIIVDATASDDISTRYVDFLKAGFHIVTPNKRANTMGQDYYNQLKSLTKDHRLHYRYEATVGAGLPVINTLQNLINSGDDIINIQGILSGTLSYIFNNLVRNVPFSDIVKEAHQNGFTEPDPRDDLSGMDVARKILILARESGHKIELDAVKVTPVLPDEFMSMTLDEFWKELPKVDESFKKLHDKASAKGNRLRYVASFDNGTCLVSMQEVPEDHLLAKAGATDNIVQIKTKRYFESPLTVHGPGAGREVTAGGIFADIISLALHLS